MGQSVQVDFKRQYYPKVILTKSAQRVAIFEETRTFNDSSEEKVRDHLTATNTRRILINMKEPLVVRLFY